MLSSIMDVKITKDGGIFKATVTNLHTSQSIYSDCGFIVGGLRPGAVETHTSPDVERLIALSAVTVPYIRIYQGGTECKQTVAKNIGKSQYVEFSQDKVKTIATGLNIAISAVTVAAVADGLYNCGSFNTPSGLGSDSSVQVLQNDFGGLFNNLDPSNLFQFGGC